MVFGTFKVNMGGAGFSPAAGVFTVTPPVAVHSDLLTFSTWFPVGKAILSRNAAVVNSSVLQVFYDIGTNLFVFRCPDATAWSNANPFAIGQLDKLSGFFHYPTSAA